MRVTVTGGLGFIGSFVAEELVRRGHDVLVIDRCIGNVVEDVDGAKVVRRDVREIEPEALFPQDLIVHCAAPVGAVALLTNAESVTHEIVDVTHHVARIALHQGTPIINISTSEVYGFSGEYHESDDLRVPDKHSARLEYAVGKIASEHLLHGFKELAFTNIRPFNVTGPRQTSAKGFVLPTFCEQALAGEPLTVFGDGTQERAFTSVYDLAMTIADIAERESHTGETFNVGNPHNQTSINGLARRVLEITGSDSPIHHTDGKAVHGEGYEEAEGIVKVPNISALRDAGFAPPMRALDDLIHLTLQDQKVAA